jgi:tetratricopeptide (TPR) repeat protein
MSEINGTQPTRSNLPATKRKAKAGNWLFGVLGFFLLILVGIGGGYLDARVIRVGAQETQVSQQLAAQFDLGMQAMNAGQYDVAQQHFQYVININPNYPGAQAAYTQLLLRMKVSPTPVFTSSPTISLTADQASAAQIFNRVQALFAAKPQSVQDWDTVLSTLDSLRKADPTYQAAQVDGMYYMALRQRGVAQIFAQPCQNINLEGGIYDLTRAENFGQLDGYADSLRTYARLYISGSTFWEIDWTQAQYYFNQVYQALPDLMDSSCTSAAHRWAQATIKYADQLLAKGDYCGADQQYQAAAAVSGPEIATAKPTADFADRKCHPPAPTQVPETPTPTGAPPVPTDTPTP